MTEDTPPEPPARAPRLPGDPTLSVVVTCYNYGHFVESCLESLYAQSCPPDEIVVVDDGSTDASGALLQAHLDRVTVIATPNSGQAAAFNRGFAATSGDIVLFLDADDLLDPVAVETIATCWADDLAALTFGLRTVDAAGRGTGVYSASLSADTGDNRPRLLATGTFAFPPTSGNAFSRAFLEAVLPMPEARWRISADCYLIRAAALFGRFAHVPRVLGSYRIHGGNNYALGMTDHSDLARRAENHNDVADALWSLAEKPDRFTRDPDEAKALAAALRRRARAVLDDLDGAESWATNGHRVEMGAQGDAPARLASPRWPVHLPFDRWVGPDRSAPVPALEDLIVPDIAANGCASPPSTVLEFTIDPHPDMLALKLHLAPLDAEACLVPIVVRIDGTPAWQGELGGETHLTIPIRQAHRDICRRLRIEVNAPGQGRSAAIVLGLEVATHGTEFPAPILDSGGWRPTDEALGAALDPREWKIGPTGGASLVSGSGHLRFSVPAGVANDLMLDFAGWPPKGSLSVAENGHILFVGTTGAQRTILVRLPATAPPVGKHNLHLRFEPDGADGGRVPLSIATIGLLAHGRSEAAPEAPLNLGETVHFGAGRGRADYLSGGWDMSEPSGTRNLAAEATLAFRPPEGAVEMRLRLELATVHDPVPGVRHIVGVSLGGDMIAALALEGEGTIDVPLPDARGQRGVRLVLHSAYLGEPCDDTGPKDDLGAEAAAGMRGDAGMPTADAAQAGVQVAAFARDMTGVMAMLELRSVTLLGLEDASARKPMPRSAPPQEPAVQRLLARAARVLDSDGPDADAAALRAEVTALVATCSPAACSLIAATPGAIERLAGLGSRSRHRRRCAAEEAALAALQSRATPEGAESEASVNGRGDAERLRHALLAILHSTAADVPHMADLDRLPPPLLWSIPALAEWLATPPDIETLDEHGRYVAFLGRLLGNMDRILSREPEGSALFRLAALTLMRLRSTRMIFGSGVLRDVIRLRGRCIERLLTREGAPLAAPRLARDTTGRLRIGVMVRNVTPSPEGWALSGMYGALDPDRFERVLIRLDAQGKALDTGGIFAEELCLQGLDLAASVEAIRALELDMFLTGAYAGEWEKAGLILAHRLAPVQIWPAAVCPTTGGFRSFDSALSARATEPENPERHYMQPLAWIEGPLQAAYAFPPPAHTRNADPRKALSIKRGRIMLASGAMAHKITDSLLSAWAEILAAAPSADLVLYPFAPNWSMAFAEDRFRARIDRHLAKAGVGAERVRLLATQTTEGVSAIVRAADLYLDSFPYTGATTVCEALSCGTPALTLAGDSLRELTGTSWVRAFGLPELVADTPPDYVARASALAADPGALKALRGKLKARLASGPPPHCATEAFGAAFSNALWRIAEESGKFPELSSRPAWDMAAVDSATRATPHSPAVVLRLTSPATRLVVLTSPRCGSSLLCHMLNATPEICCHYELFHEDMIEYYGATVRDKAAIAERDADPVGFLERTFAKGFDAGYRLVGFKHMGFFSKAVSGAVTADPDVRIVILRRKNLLAKFSSLGIAEMTSQWKVGTGQKVQRPKIRFDPKRFEGYQHWDDSLSREIHDLLAEHGRDALFLEYTDLRAAETGLRLGAFLGLDLHWNSEVGLQRLNPGRILDRFSNPAAVRAFLARRGVPEWAEDG